MEAFRDKSYSGSQSREVANATSDLKKSIFYLVVILIGFSTYHLMNKPIPVPPPQDKIVQVDFIQIFESHKNTDSYCIRYFDKAGEVLWTDSYKELKDRDAVVSRIFDKNGTPKVSMVYKRINGKQAVEIANKPISL